MLRRLFYTLWYYRKPPWDTGITPPELLAFINNNPPGRALDLGCGTGTNSIELANHGWQVVGVDFIARAIRQARKKARHLGIKVEFFIDDVTRLEQISGNFDLVLDIGCFHSLPQNKKFVYAQNLKRLLAPSGTYLLYGFVGKADESDSGITSNDLELILNSVSLLDRDDGTERGLRPSAWFTFKAR
jgi:cyclopropane fatty-acyl-phospholipid synthase-like methyltransferase